MSKSKRKLPISRTRLLRMETLEDRRVMAISVTQVADLNTEPGRPVSVLNSLEIDDTLFFARYTPEHGQELWRTDGTSAGTHIVKDIDLGYQGSFPSFLTNVNGTLYFVATTAAGSEIWKSDGTPNGTLKVTNFQRSLNSTGQQLDPVINTLVNLNGKLVFVTDGNKQSNQHGGKKLWTTDGTWLGTKLVKDVLVDKPDSYRFDSAVVNNQLFFSATDTSGSELWKSDGTSQGTVKVHDIFADEQSSQPSNLTNVNGTLFFFADDGAHGRELWKSNGTSAGTALVKDARPGPSANYVASTPTALNGKLIYSQVDSTTYENSVWVSDGSVTGTHKLANTGGKYDNAARYFTTVGANVFFFASDTDEANWNKLHTLWKTDGTTVGTRRIKHFEDVNLFPWNVMNFRGSLYFTLFDGGNETLWKSDGTSATTKLTGLSASRIVPFKNQLLINQSGKGLYFSDGNALVGNEIRDLSVTNESSNPTALQNIDGTLYFTAAPTGAVAGKTFQINRSGGEIQPALNWPINPERNKRAIQFGGNYFEANSNTLSRADTPTAEREIVFDGVNGRITHLQATNTHIFFCFEPLGVLDENAKVQLWVSDGTRAGTKLLQSFHKIIWNSDLQVVNNRLLFSVFTTSTQCNLWTSDGTSIGTKLVKDIRPGAITLANVVHPMDTVANIHYFTNVYKIGDVKHTELWRSNGTAAGTIKLATLGAEKNEVRILDSIAFQSKLLFRISGPNRPYMITDGTAVGTQRIQNSQFHEFQSIDLLRASNTAFYFAGTDYGGRYGLWKSNGTPAGTVLIKEVDFNEFRISNIVVNHSQITFSLESTTQNDLGVAKQELWSTNGTLAGTFHVGTFDYLKFSDDGILGKNLYFAASNGKGNVELWTTDGTILGTKRLKDIREGMYASFPMEFIAVGNTMYFTADSRTHGRELWKIVDSDLAS